jgi:hypothetical protein
LGFLYFEMMQPNGIFAFFCFFGLRWSSTVLIYSWEKGKRDVVAFLKVLKNSKANSDPWLGKQNRSSSKTNMFHSNG